MQIWSQSYDPLGNWFLSALVAALPVIVLLYMLAVKQTSAPAAAAGGAITALLVAIFFAKMPVPLALTSFLYGSAFGLLPIGYVVFAAIFLYQISLDSGQFEIMKASIANLTTDRRLQAVLIAFSFGALVEGAAGFGTPVAVSAALMVGLGFKPFYAAALCLIANTAPVAFGSVGTPLLMLETVTGIPLADLSAMNGAHSSDHCRSHSRVAGVGHGRMEEDQGSYAGSSRERRVVCDNAVPLEQLHRRPTGRYRRWSRFAVCHCPLHEGMETEASIYLFEEDKGVVFKQTHHSWGRGLYGWLPFLILGAFVLVWGWPSVKTKLDNASVGVVKSRYLIDVPLLDRTYSAFLPSCLSLRWNELSTTSTGCPQQALE